MPPTLPHVYQNGTSPPAEHAPEQTGAFQRSGLGYEYEAVHPETGVPLGVRLSMDYLTGRGDSYAGELVVQTTAGKHIHGSRLVLANNRDRVNIANYLAERTRKAHLDIPWTDVIETFCTLVLKSERHGAPFMRIGRLEQVTSRPLDLIERILPTGKPVSWYGKNGTGKGWLAAAAAICVATGTDLAGLRSDGHRHEVLELDWEDSPSTLDERLKAVARGMGIPLADIPLIHYRRMSAPLGQDVNTIVRYVREHDIDLIICDSVEMAMDAGGGGGFGESGIKSLYRALRHLEPATVLLIDHIAAQTQEAEESGKLAGKAYGSSYKMNEVRAAWELTKEQEADSDEQLIGWTHTKHNHTRKYKPFAMRIVFEGGENGGSPDAVRFEKAEITETEKLSRTLTLPERIAGLLARGPRVAGEIVDALELGKGGEDKVRNALNRGTGKRFVKLPTGAWGLLDKPASLALVQEAFPTRAAMDGEQELPF